ncbi:MAG: FkbM family methyltransferase [Desulfuromusa sp.]|nr:FkbM family methyltransferase [Desulfuromusa sp.]
MGMLRTIKLILSHPLNQSQKLAAILRYARWQIGSRVLGAPIAIRFVDQTRLLVRRGMKGATQNIYCGLHEFEDMAFVLHTLTDSDGFVDVGANIGSYSILAAGAVGARCVSIEPILSTYTHLIDNVRLNGIDDRVMALNIGIGKERGILRFTYSFDSVNHVLAESEKGNESIKVEVECLDEILSDFEPMIIKIDVEGFETNVITGAHKVLSRNSLFAVILELNGSGDRYGFDENDIHRRMLNYGFGTFRYLPFERKLVALDGTNAHSGNTLYIRLNAQGNVATRLRDARKYMTSVGIEV